MSIKNGFKTFKLQIQLTYIGMTERSSTNTLKNLLSKKMLKMMRRKKKIVKTRRRKRRRIKRKIRRIKKIKRKIKRTRRKSHLHFMATLQNHQQVLQQISLTSIQLHHNSQQGIWLMQMNSKNSKMLPHRTMDLSHSKVLELLINSNQQVLIQVLTSRVL